MEEKVLIVEDDPMISELLQARLELIGISSRLEEDPDGLRLVMKSEFEPEYIILDLMLEKENGLDFLISIRERWPEASIFIFTAFPEYKQKVPVLQHYINGFYSKTEISELLRIIQTGLA
jgi:DNA-binding response OmpR family regulator